MRSCVAIACRSGLRSGIALALLTGAAAAQATPAAMMAAPASSPPFEPSSAASSLFALIVGVNRNPERDQPPLSYADDDAARYRDLFRALGAQTTLLATLDENTRTLHPEAQQDARPARREQIQQAVAQLAENVRRARARGVRTTVYFIYAGHGDTDDDEQPALTLEDGRLDADHLLSDVVTPAGADETHVIIDACRAYLFALPRGPGGTRRPVEGFAERAGKRAGKDGAASSPVGFLLASSANGDSHEWSGFEAGVFSHEVRSGLYGAADANADGIVTYAEIAAFVTRANASITVERYRPQIIARPPPSGGTLLDLRTQRRDLRFEGKEARGHFLLEDARGVRLADFHSSGRVPVAMIRPADGLLYVRRLPGGEERALPAATGLVSVMDLPVEPPRERPRGAAAHAFAQTFLLSFDEGAVVAYEEAVLSERVAAELAVSRAREHTRRVAGTVVMGAAAASLVVAASFAVAALSARDTSGMLSQQAVADRNDTIRSRSRWAGGALAGAGVCAAVGALLLWHF